MGFDDAGLHARGRGGVRHARRHTAQPDVGVGDVHSEWPRRGGVSHRRVADDHPAPPAPHARDAAAADENPKVVQKRLEHTTFTTTLDIHSHVTQTMQRSASTVSQQQRRRRRKSASTAQPPDETSRQPSASAHHLRNRVIKHGVAYRHHRFPGGVDGCVGHGGRHECLGYPCARALHRQHVVVAQWATGRVPAPSGHALAETCSVLTRFPGDARVDPADAVTLIDENFAESCLARRAGRSRCSSRVRPTGVSLAALHMTDWWRWPPVNAALCCSPGTLVHGGPMKRLGCTPKCSQTARSPDVLEQLWGCRSRSRNQMRFLPERLSSATRSPSTLDGACSARQSRRTTTTAVASNNARYLRDTHVVPQERHMVSAPSRPVTTSPRRA